MKNSKIVIAVDFDGTCVTHNYPYIGEDIGAVDVLKEVVAKGHSLILWTMRSKKQLEDAVGWFSKNDIPLYGVQKNPTQDQWTSSLKCYAQMYIDDAALGCPLIYPKDGSRPYANWKKIKNVLIKQGIL